MINTPGILTDDGNIRIHNREGARIPIFFEDEFGNPRNMSNAVVVFIAEHAYRIVLEPGVAPNEKVLKIVPEQFSAHVDKMFEFVVREETVSEMPSVWRGKVIVEGW